MKPGMASFNPWFIGRVGINALPWSAAIAAKWFQSLVYWKGGDKLDEDVRDICNGRVSILGLLEGWG